MEKKYEKFRVQKRAGIRPLARGCVFFTGMAFITILAVPAVLLFGMIYFISKLTDVLTDKIDKS